MFRPSFYDIRFREDANSSAPLFVEFPEESSKHLLLKFDLARNNCQDDGGWIVEVFFHDGCNRFGVEKAFVFESPLKAWQIDECETWLSWSRDFDLEYIGRNSLVVMFEAQDSIDQVDEQREVVERTGGRVERLNLR